MARTTTLITPGCAGGTCDSFQDPPHTHTIPWRGGGPGIFLVSQLLGAVTHTQVCSPLSWTRALPSPGAQMSHAYCLSASFWLGWASGSRPIGVGHPTPPEQGFYLSYWVRVLRHGVRCCYRVSPHLQTVLTFSFYRPPDPLRHSF